MENPLLSLLKGGVVSIPDGYAIFFTSPKKARWAIIEVELASHPVYEHVIPQLSKFNRGIEDSSTRKKLVEVLYGIFDDTICRLDSTLWSWLLAHAITSSTAETEAGGNVQLLPRSRLTWGTKGSGTAAMTSNSGSVAIS